MFIAEVLLMSLVMLHFDPRNEPLPEEEGYLVWALVAWTLLWAALAVGVLHFVVWIAIKLWDWALPALLLLAGSAVS